MRIPLLAISLFAMSGFAHADPDANASIFVKREYHDKDFISGIGAEIRITDPHSHFGASLNTSIGPARVTDYDGYEQEYMAWEGGIKLGYFSKLFVYVEAGVDLGELTFDDRDEDHHHHDYYDDNHVDGYIGAGLGVNLGRLKFEGFSRYRQIDGENWDAPKQTYTGVQLSINF